LKRERREEGWSFFFFFDLGVEFLSSPLSLARIGSIPTKKEKQKDGEAAARARALFFPNPNTEVATTLERHEARRREEVADDGRRHRGSMAENHRSPFPCTAVVLRSILRLSNASASRLSPSPVAALFFLPPLAPQGPAKSPPRRGRRRRSW